MMRSTAPRPAAPDGYLRANDPTPARGDLFGFLNREFGPSRRRLVGAIGFVAMWVVPAVVALGQSNLTLAVGWLFLCSYLLVCAVNMDVAVAAYLVVMAWAVEIPEFASLTYKGLVLQNVMLGMMLLAVVARVSFRKWSVVSSPVNLPLFVLFGLYVPLSFWSTGPYYPTAVESLTNLKRVLIYPALYWIVLNGGSTRVGRRVRFYSGTLIFVAIVGSVWGLWYYAGYAAEATYFYEARIHATGLGQTFGVTESLGALLLLAYALTDGVPTWRRMLAWAGTALLIVACLLGLSRALGGAVVLSALVVIVAMRGRRSLGWVALTLGIVVLALLIFPQIVTRVEVTYGPRGDGSVGFDESFAYRLYYLWPVAVDLIRDHFATGIGFENYRRIAGMNSHNQYLSWLAELGVVGFTAAVWFLGRVCRFLWKRFRVESDMWARNMAVSTFGVMVGAMVWMMFHDAFLFEWLNFPMVFLALLGDRAYSEVTADRRRRQAGAQ